MTKMRRNVASYEAFDAKLVPTLAPASIARLVSDAQHDIGVLADANHDLRAALKALLVEVDAEIEQRQSSGNDEYWAGLKALSDAGHAAVAEAGAE